MTAAHIFLKIHSLHCVVPAAPSGDFVWLTIDRHFVWAMLDQKMHAIKAHTAVFSSDAVSLVGHAHSSIKFDPVQHVFPLLGSGSRVELWVGAKPSSYIHMTRIGVLTVTHIKTECGSFEYHLAHGTAEYLLSYQMFGDCIKEERWN